MPKRKLNGSITFSGGDKKIVVRIEANNSINTTLVGNNRFVENNGFVVMQATHFTRQTIKPLSQWKAIKDLGYNGEVLQASPMSINSKSTTNVDSIKKFNASVEYDFYSLTPARPIVHVYALPTHPINNNYSVSYAVSIDDGPIKTVDIKTFGRSEEWKQNVLRNRAERKIELPFLNAGKHTLKIYQIDAGVMLDEIRIDLGGLKKAYSALPETKIASTVKQ